MGHPPVVIVDSGGVPRTSVTTGNSPAATVSTSGYGRPITLTDSAPPIMLFNEDGTPGGLRGDVYIDFTAMADGAPGAAVTGEPTVRDTTSVDTNVAVATVSGGALVSPASGSGTQTGAYTGWRLPEDVKSFYADVSFGDSDDVAAMISAADVSLTAIIDSAVHITFQAASWHIQWYSNGTPTETHNGTFTSVAFNQRCRVGWRLSGNDVYLLLPNGQEIGPYTSSAVTTRTNHCVIFEHFRGTSGAPGLKFYAVAANMYVDPVAAGRTQLLTAPNDLSNAAWPRNRLGTPTTGIADADGGTLASRVLETAATGAHNLRQTVSKDASAKRYTWRYKIKPIGRDWVYAFITDDVFSDQAARYLQLSTGTFGTEAGSFTDKTWMVYALGGGWYQVQVDFTSDTGTALNPFISLATANGTNSYLGEIDKGADIFDCWLFERPT